VHPVLSIHGLRFLIGLRFAAGDFVGVGVEAVGVVATGLGTGKANVGDGEAGAVVDTPGEGDGVVLSTGLCTGLGVGEGGIIFSQ
jgi:hypothetical protein